MFLLVRREWHKGKNVRFIAPWRGVVNSGSAFKSQALQCSVRLASIAQQYCFQFHDAFPAHFYRLCLRADRVVEPPAPPAKNVQKETNNISHSNSTWDDELTRAQIYPTHETTAIRSSYIWIYILRDCHHWIKHISWTNACTLSFILTLWPFDQCRKVLLSIFACHHSSDNLQTHYTLNCKKILIIQFHVYSKYYSPQVEF